jgi:1-deoxy-D-xylulose-5-phosphate reductoisomerase
LTRTVSVLGSTGSVGRSTISLLDGAEPGAFQVEALVANRDVAALAAQALRHRARLAVVADPAAWPALKAALSGSGIALAAGWEAVVEAASRPADWTMAAIVGAAGLRSTLAAVARGGTLAIANKESLVCAGALVLEAARRGGATLLPCRFRAQRDLPGAAPRGPARHRADHPDRLRRPLPRLAGGADGGRHAGTGAAPPGLVDGRQDQHRFGYHDEQGPRGDRGRAALPRDARPDRGAGSSAIRGPRHGPVQRRLDPRAARDARHAHADRPCARLARAAHVEIPRLDLAALARLDFQAPDPVRFPALRWRGRPCRPGAARQPY